MPDSTPAPVSGAPEKDARLTPWLNHRRKRFWFLVAVVVYTLVGFFLVPVLVSHLAVSNIKSTTDRDATIVEVRFNPYVLSLEVNGFTLPDTDGEILASFDTLVVNFQLSSLFRWAWTFREIRLDGAYVFHEQFAPGDSRLTRLLDDVERLNPTPEVEEPPGSLPRLLVQDLSLNEGSLMFRDHAPGETVEIPAGPVTVAVHDLNTLPDRDGRQEVQIRLARGALLSWQGAIGLQPLRSSGSLTLENSHLDTLIPYLKSRLPLESIRAVLSASTDYSLSQDDNGVISLRLSALESRLEDVVLAGLDPASEFLSFDALEVLGGELNYPANTLSLQAVRLRSPFVDAWLDSDGQPGLMQLVPDTGTESGGDDDSPPEPWSVSIAEFTIENGRAAFEDRSVEPHGKLDIESLGVELTGIDLVDDTRMPLSLGMNFSGGGHAGFEGELTLLPAVALDGQATLEAIPLALAQSYVQQQLAISIENGALQTAAAVRLNPDQTFTATGQLDIDTLSIRDTGQNEPLLAWERMAIDRYEVDSAAARANVSSIRFTRPYGRIHIAEDLSTNIDALVLDTGEEPAAEEPSEPGWSALVGGIAVDDGSMDFSDFSLPLPFSTRITGLDGTISTIDSGSAEPSEIGLEGQVDDYGLARIAGSMNLLDPIAHTDVSVEFRNLLMTNLSPYTVQFAGRKIAEGKLDLDLLYRIENGQLDGQNDIVLGNLVLGEEVDHPDAKSLPLGLAVALLKDANGVIDIELPVTGDVNDPEFKIGGVVWKAIAGLVTRVVAAPFKLLGGLIGVESEDFGQFRFLAGRADLSPPEREQVSKLMEALEKRPELGLEIAGSWDPAIDRPALQLAGLRASVFERLGRDPTQEGDSSTMLGEEVRAVLESLFTERFPGSALADIEAAHTAPPPDNPEGTPVFDATAYTGDLRDRLVESEPVGEAELKTLAEERARAVSDAFLEAGLAPNRVRQGEPVASESEDGEWVVMELGVTTE